MPALRQVSFNGGEFSPFLWGRTDLEKYGQGARRLLNFFVNREGSAVSRPGTTYVNTTKGGAKVRLIPFVVSDSVSYVLEVGHQYIRFYSGGSRVETAPGTPYEIATTYTLAELRDITYAQTGDILTLAHPNHAPAELRRYASTNWTLTDVVFALPEPYFRLIDTPATFTTNAMIVGEPLAGEDATHPRREWIYLETATMQRKSDGSIVESLPVEVTQKWDGLDSGTAAGFLAGYFGDGRVNDVVVDKDLPIVLRRGVVVGTPALPDGWGAADDYAILAYNYYRGRGRRTKSLYGFIGTTTTDEFVDIGSEPDYAIQPPQGRHPFEVKAPDLSLVRTETPRAVAFFQERRTWGGTSERPCELWLSRSGDYFNHDQHIIHLAGEALEYELASRKRETVRHILGMDRLFVFTDASVWTVTGQQGNPLDYDSVDARLQVGVGINHMPPLVVEGGVLYARSKGAGVRDLAFDVGRDGLLSRDVSLISQHLFMGVTSSFPIVTATVIPLVGTVTATSVESGFIKSLIDWTYAEDPWGVVWAIRSDNTMLSLTYNQERGIWAWARHETEGGYVSVCAVPEGNDDGVYVAVLRSPPNQSTQCYIERMTSRVRQNLATDDGCLDSALYVYGTTPTDTITGLDWLEGMEVYATGIGLPVYGPMTVVGGTITLPEVPAANAVDGVATPGSEFAAETALYVGLRFQPELETLDVSAGAEGRLRKKNVTKVGLEVDQSRGLQIGPDFDSMTDWPQRQVSDSYNGVSAASELVELDVQSPWDSGARIAVRQRDPLPVTILGVVRRYDVGD